MTRTALILLASLGLAGCDKTPSSGPDTSAMANGSAIAVGADAGVPVAVPVETAAATPDFLTRLAISDMYEVEAGKLAASRSTNPDIKAFAQMLVKDHTATTATVKGIVAEDKLPAPPKALDEDHAKLIADLKAAKPDAFDTAYLDQQTDAHQKALALLNAYAGGGENAKLKAFAAETAPKVQMHLDKAKSLDNGGADDASPAKNMM